MLTLRMVLVGMVVSTLLMWSSSQSVAGETSAQFGYESAASTGRIQTIDGP